MCSVIEEEKIIITKTDYEQITDIINNWNPIELFPYAPSDEYEGEIKILESFIKNSSEINATLTIKVTL